MRFGQQRPLSMMSALCHTKCRVLLWSRLELLPKRKLVWSWLGGCEQKPPKLIQWHACSLYVCKINPRPLATVAAGVLPVFAWRSCGVEGTRRSWCASFSRSFRSNYWWMSDCRACWRCGRSVLSVRLYDTVPELCKRVDMCCMGQGSFVIGLWRSWGRSGRSMGWSDFCSVFFPFIFLSMHLCVCLSLPIVLWSMHVPLPDLRQENYVAYQKEKSCSKETWRMNCSAVFFQLWSCAMQIFSSPALQVNQ